MGSLSTNGIQEPPCPRRGVQVESDINHAKIKPRDSPDAVEAVPQGAAVDMERCGRIRIAATTFQVVTERQYQRRILALIVVEKGPKPFTREPLHRAGAVGGVDQAIETQFV